MLTKLNDLFFESQNELKNYIYTGKQVFIANALLYYKQYKLKGGKKTIKVLEELQDNKTSQY